MNRIGIIESRSGAAAPPQTALATRNRPRRVGLLGPYGWGNLGDAAIQDAMIRNLRERWPDARIYGICLNPEDTRTRHGIEAYPARPKHTARGRWTALIWLWREIAFFVRSYFRLLPFHTLVVSGGGQLDDAWGGARANPLTLLRWALLAKLTRTRFVVASVGAGPIFSPWSRRFLRWTLHLAEYRSYRDADSQRLMARTCFTDSGPVVPDLAYSLCAEEVEPAPASEPRIVGIGAMAHVHPKMAPWPGPDPERYRRYLETLADFTKWLVRQRGRKPLLFVGEVSHDRWVIDDLLAALRKRGVAEEEVLSPAIQTVPELLDHLRRAEVVVASRFHGVLLPLLLKTPVLALTYHPKVTELMRDMRQLDYCLDIDSASLPAMQERFDRLCRDQREIRRTIAARQAVYDNQLREQYDLLFPAESRR